jgi:phosphoglycolate phosphatase
MPAGSPDSLAHELDEAFKHFYADRWQTGSVLYPGIKDLIHQLHAGGHSLAVLSNKPDTFTREIVEHFFPGSLFDQVLGHSERFPRKPEPDAALHLLRVSGVGPSAAKFIGDSDIDRMTAENAGIPFVGVSWGYHPADGLGDHIADTTDTLFELLND